MERSKHSGLFETKVIEPLLKLKAGSKMDPNLKLLPSLKLFSLEELQQAFSLFT